MAKKKGQKDKQRSTQHAYTTKDRVTRTPLKTTGALNEHQWIIFDLHIEIDSFVTFLWDIKGVNTSR